MLRDKPYKAKKILDNLIAKNAELDPKFHELLDKINSQINSSEI